jgi:hypothetical protein
MRWGGRHDNGGVADRCRGAQDRCKEKLLNACNLHCEYAATEDVLSSICAPRMRSASAFAVIQCRIVIVGCCRAVTRDISTDVIRASAASRNVKGAINCDREAPPIDLPLPWSPPRLITLPSEFFCNPLFRRGRCDSVHCTLFLWRSIPSVSRTSCWSW